MLAAEAEKFIRRTITEIFQPGGDLLEGKAFGNRDAAHDNIAGEESPQNLPRGRRFGKIVDADLDRPLPFLQSSEKAEVAGAGNDAVLFEKSCGLVDRHAGGNRQAHRRRRGDRAGGKEPELAEQEGRRQEQNKKRQSDGGTSGHRRSRSIIRGATRMVSS
jgi:hypothetical protein